MNYRSFMERIGSKSGKRSKSGQNFARCTGTHTGVYRYTYRGVPVHPNRMQGVPVHVQRCTGTPHQKQTCTGTCSGCTDTCSGCTGTCVPKRPRMLCFCIIKPNSCTDSL